jgi:hypothetical protein
MTWGCLRFTQICCSFLKSRWNWVIFADFKIFSIVMQGCKRFTVLPALYFFYEFSEHYLIFMPRFNHEYYARFSCRKQGKRVFAWEKCGAKFEKCSACPFTSLRFNFDEIPLSQNQFWFWKAAAKSHLRYVLPSLISRFLLNGGVRIS